ncbi:AAA family ATPase [Candidatus Woesearchaeota archaeon]|nr:AAA family ATPase [Candidatus Woesearchaeota archaeon]
MVVMENVKKTFEYLFKEMEKVVVGQDELLNQCMVAILTDSNALIESYPGLAKTLTVRTLAQLMDMKFSRIQNTPDLMPSDITGTYIIEETDGKRSFKFQPGPIFANIVLADEINRATPKTQSALLEAMQEKQVTVGNKTYELDRPFFVLATQNPIEQEGSLAMDETVFVNGMLLNGHDLLTLSKECLAEDRNGIRLYRIDAWTLCLNTDGKLEKQPCFLYTLPYKDEFVQVTTRTGKRITATKNHPFLVNDNGIIGWKKAEDLTKADYLLNPSRIHLDPAHPLMDHASALARIRTTGKNLPQDIPFDVDFAFWIAFVLSDGAIGKKCVEICQRNYPEAFDRWVDISRRYGFEPAIHERLHCRYARIYSRPLIEYLRVRFGVLGGKDKEIPAWFLSFPQDLNREFVRTFIALESSLRDNRIVFTQKSRTNVNIIAHMLLREGILSWLRHDSRIFRLRIQGEDLPRYLQIIGWLGEAPDIRIGKSSFRVVPVNRRAILRLVEIFGLNSFHTLKGRTAITARPWYGSYKGIKEGETVMSTESLRCFAADMRNELAYRTSPIFSQLLHDSPRHFAAGIGTPITEVASHLPISKHQVWQHYDQTATSAQITSFLSSKQESCIAEATTLLSYLDGLLFADVYYDPIKTILHVPGSAAFGLTVPSTQNYIAGLGACGINHNTYPLPEAQSDRFLLKILITYPKFDDEVEIVTRYAEDERPPVLRPVIKKDSILQLQKLTRQVPVNNDLKKYVVELVNKTRTKKDLIEYGASPRASIGLILAAKARALIDGRKYVSKEDINALALPVLRHRIILNFEAERKGMTTDDAIKSLLK